MTGKNKAHFCVGCETIKKRILVKAGGSSRSVYWCGCDEWRLCLAVLERARNKRR